MLLGIPEVVGLDCNSAGDRTAMSITSVIPKSVHNTHIKQFGNGPAVAEDLLFSYSRVITHQENVKVASVQWTLLQLRITGVPNRCTDYRLLEFFCEFECLGKKLKVDS